MKICTLTCHNVYNPGASLQAYALCRYLSDCGHTVSVIDYRPDYLSGHFSLTAVPDQWRRRGLSLPYLLAKLPGRLMSRRRKKPFDRFTDSYLPLTPRSYNTVGELRADPPQADCYVAGSDQIWNTLFPTGRDAAFFLDFGPDSVRRVSYAASFATPGLAPDCREAVRRHLQRFDVLSVREGSGVTLVSDLGLEAVQVADPVLLLDKDRWLALAEPSGLTLKAPGGYIALYDFDESPQTRAVVDKLRSQTGLPVFSIGGARRRYADRSFTRLSPLQFVDAIAQAEYVVTGSFHATVFSMMFQKPFAFVERLDGLNERMTDLLRWTGLEQRVATAGTPADRLTAPIDYDAVRSRIDEMTACSKDFLRTALGDGTNGR